jgi:hypothetical protein
MQGLQRLIRTLDKKAGVIRAKHQRWPDLENIGMWPGDTDQHAPLARHVDDISASARGRRRGGTAAPELHADEQASAADFGNQLVPRLQLPKPFEQIGAAIPATG